MWDFGIFNNFQKFQVCGNIISAQISKNKNDRLKSANFGTLIYERTHIKNGLTVPQEKSAVLSLCRRNQIMYHNYSLMLVLTLVFEVALAMWNETQDLETQKVESTQQWDEELDKKLEEAEE